MRPRGVHSARLVAGGVHPRGVRAVAAAVRALRPYPLRKPVPLPPARTQRAFARTTHALAAVHSRPPYHGAFVALWVALPALALLAGWAVVSEGVVADRVISTVPAATRPARRSAPSPPRTHPLLKQYPELLTMIAHANVVPAPPALPTAN